MDLHTVKTKRYCLLTLILLIGFGILSLGVGKYPLSMAGLIHGDAMQWNVFLTLRVSRTLVGIIGGIALGITGFVYQTIFRNPLASPDMVGVSSGASAGAAFGILFLEGAAAVTMASWVGAAMAVTLSLLISNLDRSHRNGTVILAGMAIHTLAQTVLMCMKLTADPEQELASIEYWMMGSLQGISGYSIRISIVFCLLGILVLVLLHRQILLLSADEGEAKMLGVSVGKMRILLLMSATVVVASVVSLTGLISFVGLLAPHGARLLTRNHRIQTMLLSGGLGGILLCAADILARSVAQTELPVSIFTSFLGVPFLIYLILRERSRL